MGVTIEVMLTESFEFSASHRLYCADMSDEENARVFGKCSNPNGHGHNYVIDVTVKGSPEPDTGLLLQEGQLARVVNARVIDRFDHKHLNIDCEEFRELNPSIENIARTIWRLLEGELAPCRLHCVRAWETPKTFAECSSGD
jgi:6-pyruvoyltetrahydropterin/6-carboxytetrahydropterin synthase